MKRGKGLTIRQKVDGHEVRIEELEKSLRARSNHIDRLEQLLLQALSPPFWFSDSTVPHKFGKPIKPGYYWAVRRIISVDRKQLIIILVTRDSTCYEAGAEISRPIDSYKLIASVSPP